MQGEARDDGGQDKGKTLKPDRLQIVNGPFSETARFSTSASNESGAECARWHGDDNRVGRICAALQRGGQRCCARAAPDYAPGPLRQTRKSWNFVNFSALQLRTETRLS